ncbi:MAG: hypothetical protein AAF998_02730 [Bacteroidota bacterium]
MEASKDRLKRLKIRDKIKFKTCTPHSEMPATRMVNKAVFPAIGGAHIEVEYHGPTDFRVHLEEVSKVYPRVIALETQVELGIVEGNDYWIETDFGNGWKLQGIVQLVPKSVVKFPD